MFLDWGKSGGGRQRRIGKPEISGYKKYFFLALSIFLATLFSVGFLLVCT